MSLPVEMAEEILLWAHADDLPSLCDTGRIYKNLCSDYRFWARRFQREHLSLFFLEGKRGTEDPACWYEVYRKSLRARGVSEGFLSLEGKKLISFFLVDVDPRLLEVPGLDMDKVGVYHRRALLNTKLTGRLEKIQLNYESESGGLDEEEAKRLSGKLRGFIHEWDVAFSIEAKLKVSEEEAVFFIIQGGMTVYVQELSRPSLVEIIFRLDYEGIYRW